MFNLLKYKFKNMSAPAKAAFCFTICNFVLKGIGFITGPLFTRIIPTDEFGKLSVFLSYEQLILIFATWEIQLGAYQKGVFKYKNDISFFTTATQALTNILTIIFFVFLFLFNNFVFRFTGMDSWILALLFLYLLVRPGYTCWLTRKRKSYDYKPAVAITLLYSLINIIVPLSALFVFGKTANIKFGFTLLGSSVISFVFYIRNIRYDILIKEWTKTKQYWKFCIIFEGPLVLHSLSFLILSQADRVMIGKLVGDTQAAYYSVAYSIASVVGLFQSSVNQSLQPWRYQMLEENNYTSIRKTTKGLLLVFAVIILFFILVVPEMLKFLFPDNYYEAIWCIPPISAGIFFMFLYSIFVNIEEYYEKTKYVVYVSIVCGTINIILNAILINCFGYIACAYTTLFSYILFATGHYLFMKKTLNENNIFDDVVGRKTLAVVSALVVVLSIITTITYNYPLIRYFLLVMLIIVLVFNKEKIKPILKFFIKI